MVISFLRIAIPARYVHAKHAEWQEPESIPGKSPKVFLGCTITRTYPVVSRTFADTKPAASPYSLIFALRIAANSSHLCGLNCDHRIVVVRVTRQVNNNEEALNHDYDVVVVAVLGVIPDHRSRRLIMVTAVAFDMIPEHQGIVDEITRTLHQHPVEVCLQCRIT